ncbi:hypothetical protein [Devosia sp.]
MAHSEHPTPQADFVGTLALVLAALAVLSALIVVVVALNAA